MYERWKEKHITKDKYGRVSQACKNNASKTKAQNEQRFQKNARTTQKLLVAMFRIKRHRLTTWGTGARLRMRRERTTQTLCYFTKRQGLPAEENRINIVQIILKLKLDKQKVSGHLEALKVSTPDIISCQDFEETFINVYKTKVWK